MCRNVRKNGYVCAQSSTIMCNICPKVVQFLQTVFESNDGIILVNSMQIDFNSIAMLKYYEITNIMIYHQIEFVGY